MLTDPITQIHVESHGIYGGRRVHAELILGRGVVVGHNQVQLLMRRAGLAGITGRRRWKRILPDNIASDRVERQFNRGGPNQLWVTDITEHPSREGKIYCCVIFDTSSRRVVGWSIDASSTGALVTNALGMASTAASPRAPIPRPFTPIRACPSVPGPSPGAPRTPACSPRWAASGTATTTP
jgi:putative transposase